jgi:hypothetical protein
MSKNLRMIVIASTFPGRPGDGTARVHQGSVPPAQGRLLFVGRLVEKKGLSVLIDPLRILSTAVTAARIGA